MEDHLKKEHQTEWNDNIEKTIKDLGDSAKGYKIMHIEAARKLGHLHSILMYTGIILGPLAGLVSSIGAIRQPPNSDIVFPIITTIVAFISGIIVSIIKFGSFEKNSLTHKNAAANYTSLESNVRRQLSLYRKDRINPTKYIEWLSKSYDETFSSSPFIPSPIYKNFAKNAHKLNLHIPEEYSIMISIPDLDKSKEDKSKEDKSKEDKSKEDKSKEDKSKEDKSKEDKSKEDSDKDDKSDACLDIEDSDDKIIRKTRHRSKEDLNKSDEDFDVDDKIRPESTDDNFDVDDKIRPKSTDDKSERSISSGSYKIDKFSDKRMNYELKRMFS